MSSGSCRKRKREDDSLGPEKQKQKESGNLGKDQKTNGHIGFECQAGFFLFKK